MYGLRVFSRVCDSFSLCASYKFWTKTNVLFSVMFYLLRPYLLTYSLDGSILIRLKSFRVEPDSAQVGLHCSVSSLLNVSVDYTLQLPEFQQNEHISTTPVSATASVVLAERWLVYYKFCAQRSTIPIQRNVLKSVAFLPNRSWL